MTRFVACPTCERVMDETGCRGDEQFRHRDPAQTRGIARDGEVFCQGAPTGSVRERPACR